MNIYEYLGPYLKKRREILNLSQKDVADKLGIERSTYAHWEKGDRIISTEYTYMLTKILDFDFTTFSEHYELAKRMKKEE